MKIYVFSKKIEFVKYGLPEDAVFSIIDGIVYCVMHTFAADGAALSTVYVIYDRIENYKIENQNGYKIIRIGRLEVPISETNPYADYIISKLKNDNVINTNKTQSILTVIDCG